MNSATARPIQPSSRQCVSAETASETSTAAVLITSLRLSAAVASSAAESIRFPSVRLNEASHSFTAMDSTSTAAVTGLSAVSCGCRIFSTPLLASSSPMTRIITDTASPAMYSMRAWP